jgi:hypothetical protein
VASGVAVKRTLSAPSLTLIFVARASGGLVGAGVALYVLSRIQASTGPRPLLFAIAVAIVAIVIAIVVKDQLTRRDLKRVAVDDRFLYVSSYSDSSEEVIPLTDIVRVTQRRGRTFRPISVYLRSPSRFGTRIRFQPKPEWGWAFTENTVVDELRRLAHLV